MSPVDLAEAVADLGYRLSNVGLSKGDSNGCVGPEAALSLHLEQWMQSLLGDSSDLCSTCLVFLAFLRLGRFLSRSSPTLPVLLVSDKDERLSQKDSSCWTDEFS
eukprot:TRINITY_DN113_c1_g1_i12.p2 TRINITY_DN113_c1_g1~~TRINITY_DN113_c1_g1_i12.p2  ORF type:complete len:105 (-),score=14.08 TRINITY_DN113_c1_g1_i12:1418-1732(-)